MTGSVMFDTYPAARTIPDAYLVVPEAQPRWTELPGVSLGSHENVAAWMADRHVDAGWGDDVAAQHAATGRELTYADLVRRGTALAKTLVGLGIEPGDRVALRISNVPELLVAAVGTWKAGGVVVPTSQQARAEELRFMLQDVGARFLMVWAAAGLADEVDDAISDTSVEHVMTIDETVGQSTVQSAGTLPEVASDAVAIVWHTGGTTGQPKACYHTHRRFLSGGLALGQGLGVSRGSRWACAAPVGHALGFIYNTTYTVLSGATAVFVEGFHDPRAILRAISDRKIDTFAAITASWARMLEVLRQDEGSYDLSHLKNAFAMWQSASSTVVYDGWRSRGIELRNNFGSTAFATWVLVPRPDERVPPSSLGRALPGYRVRAVERTEEGLLRDVPIGRPGQMAVRGPSGLTYWRRPDLQARDVVDGWTLSDDLIQFDRDGNAAYLGRTDFLVSTAGYKVAPVEVEQVLASHVAVREVSVVGAPDPIRQQVVMAFVALMPGVRGDDALRTELQQFVRDRLSPYKYPRRIEFVAALPRDHVGKVTQKLLMDWAERPAGVPADSSIKAHS
jgi:2-aminobenzoate-CoA ligase